jgi:hypothetical protein
MPADGHRLVVTMDEHGIHTKLVCPDQGCEPATMCACGAHVGDDAETERCYDCPSGEEPCWLKTWADNMDLAAEGWVHGTAEFIVTRLSFDGESPDLDVALERSQTP